MTRAVYVGGFGGGNSSAERVANALENRFGYEGIDTFRFSQLYTDPDTIRKATTDKVNLVTHSAGARALLSVVAIENLDDVLLLNPPLPQTIPSLLARTVTKTARMNTPGIGIHNLEDARAVANYSTDSLEEFARHPIGNFAQLGRVAHTSTIHLTARTVAHGTPTTAVWTQGDAYFRPTAITIAHLEANNARVITNIEGEHDEVILRPDAFLAQIPNPV